MGKIHLTAEEEKALGLAIDQIEQVADGSGEEAHADYREALEHLYAMRRRVVLIKYHRKTRPRVTAGAGPACPL